MSTIDDPNDKSSLRGIIAEKSGVKITFDDACLILGMVAASRRKQDIASYFGINTGRIYDIIDGDRFPDATPAPEHMLPPPGPYLSGRASAEAVRVLKLTEQMLKDQLDLVRLTIENLENT